VFGRLLDDEAGYWRIAPADPEVMVERRYVPHSLVLETTWRTVGGDVVVTEARMLGQHRRAIPEGPFASGAMHPWLGVAGR
jgi:hypothetical protein